MHHDEAVGFLQFPDQSEYLCFYKSKLMAKTKITVQGLEIAIERIDTEDYISLTDIAKQAERKPADSIADWLRNSATLRFLQTWEMLHNENFKVGQMQDFRLSATDNRKAISPKIEILRTSKAAEKVKKLK